MDYFELFGLPVSFVIDSSRLQEKYFELQKKYHPDFYSNESEEEQGEVLEKSSMINRAYKTFRDPDETIRYVLKQKNLLEDEEKYNLPPSFLAEMMELNESLMDDDSHTAEKIEALHQELYDEVKDVIEKYQDNNVSEQQLLKVKDYYFKKKYLKRIRERLNK